MRVNFLNCLAAVALSFGAILVSLVPIYSLLRASWVGITAWTDPTSRMEFVWVEGGCFQMGQTEADRCLLHGPSDKYYRDELPRHEVCVDSFWMGKYEVTVGQFRQFVKATGYKTDAEKEGWAYALNARSEELEESNGTFWGNPGFSQVDTHPVVNVSWNDAKAYAKWISSQGNGSFRLPTEAEWEYAARAGTTILCFSWDDPDKACSYANILDQKAESVLQKCSRWHYSCFDGYIYTAPVGKFKPNRFGLYDILGNVWEWCENVYDKDAYGKYFMKNPSVNSDESKRVYRGGSWYDDLRNVRFAIRLGYEPAYRDCRLGFRLLRIW